MRQHGKGRGGEVRLGSEAFGHDLEGGPTGSAAFGGADAEDPLRGALLFGNDPKGAPSGSEAFGGSEPDAPLKGALLFGNDPQGAPRGSEAFGGADSRFAFRGSEAVGAPQLVPERLFKDSLGYDFAGTLLMMDEGSLAGIRKDPRNRLRERVLAVLRRRLALEPERLRHGLGEDAIPWARLRRDRELDGKLAHTLREAYNKAPGGVLGIAHVHELLESSARMHSFALACEWDVWPVKLAVLHQEKPVAFGVSAVHKQHRFFIFRDPEGSALAYVDAVSPRRLTQLARVRTAAGETVAAFTLAQPGPSVDSSPANRRLLGKVLDKRGEPALSLEEERAAPSFFRAALHDAESDEPVGLIEDTLKGGKIRTQIELDVGMPRIVAWGLAAVLADLARLRRKGWPDVPEEQADETVESVEEALGPRRKRQ